MTTDIRWRQRFANYQRALAQLSAAVALARTRPLSDLERQGLIQAFEFTYELAWHTLKDYLTHEGITDLVGARSTLREAFQQGLIDDGEGWLAMVDARNRTSHTYDEALAHAIADAVITRFTPLFLALQERLAAR